MEGESGVSLRIIDELHSWDIQGHQKEVERGVTSSIIDEHHFRISKEIRFKGKVVLLKVSLMNFILGICKEIKWKVKDVLLEGSLTNFILRISKDIKWN